MRVLIRSAAAGDAEAMASLARQLGHPGVDAVWIAQRLATLDAEGLGAVLVAVAADGRVLGLAQLLPQQFLVEPPFVELIALVVDAAARGRRVGAALLAAVEDWARQRGFPGVYVRSNVVRERAHRYYLREGYLEQKRQAIFFKPLDRDASA
jgi:GNAT superfamily N-acetyltransferase